ncbi:hypothetical protein [Amphibacillus jilinensis]|uniref:hypothetical protein n=1 Tax=Amphibacillus jilinensis TaxID=1216008 RepID=UPI0003054C53|nr:hypothetical protein [Amphibacillus jilinensis]
MNVQESFNNPAKRAYIFLNMVKPLQQSYQKTGGVNNWTDYRSDLSYANFKEILENNEVIEKANVRSMSQTALDYVQHNQHYSKSGQVNQLLAKAYQLGMVDNNGQLINGIDQSV